MFYLYFLYQEDEVMYVGLTVDPTTRKSSHKGKRQKHTFVLIDEFSSEKQAVKKETEYIKEFNTYKNLKKWNKTPGGDYRGGIMTVESKKKLSESRKKLNLVCSDEHKSKISAANKGRKHSEEAIEKIRNAAKGRTHSAESIEKMRATKKGKVFSDEHRANLSKAHKGHIPWNKGKTGIFSEETRKQISESLKKRNADQGTRNSGCFLLHS